MGLLRSLYRARRVRPRLVAAAAVVLAVTLAYPVADAYLRGLRASTDAYRWVSPFHFNDFRAYASAIAKWSAGEPIYWRNPSGGFFATYLYPPPYLLVFLPFVWLGRLLPHAVVPFAADATEVAAVLFQVVSVLALWVGLQAVARVEGVALAWYERLLGLWLLVGFQPLLFSAKLGQVSALVAAGFCAAYVTMERGVTDARRGRTRPTTAAGGRLRLLSALASGAVTTVTSGIKLYYATAGAHLLRDRRRFLGAVVAALGTVVLSLVVFGVENHRGFLEVLAWGKGWGDQPRPIYLWNPGRYEPLYVLGRTLPSLAAALKAALALVVAVVAYLARAAPVRRETFALGLAVYPLAAPQAYAQDLVALLVVAAVLVAVEFDRGDRGRPWLPVAAVALLAVHSHGLLALLRLHEALGLDLLAVVALLQPGLWGNLLLFGLALSRVAPAADVAVPAALRSLTAS